MKTLLLSLTLILGSCSLTPALAHYVPPMGSLVTSFEYLKSDKTKLVNKSVKVKKFRKFRDEIPGSVRYLPTVSGVSHPKTGGGKASYYWQGQRTANGEVFKPDGISCAHKTLPFNTKLRVTNLLNGKSVVCRVNDRGPFIAGRVVDLSRGAARVIDMTRQGVVPVSLQVL